MAVYRHFSVYVGGRKIAELQKASYSVVTATKPVVNENGVDGYTDGPMQSTIDATTAVPVGGISVDLFGSMLRKEKLQIQLGTVDGKIHVLSNIRVTEANYDGDVENGELIGKFKFMGGKPEPVG